MSAITPDLTRSYMNRALELARRGMGWTSPNPMVGAVIVKDDRIIGEGYHERWKGPHAEVNALTNCKESPKDSTLFVTLEPCNRTGFTPPCTDSIINHQIGRVVIGALDPTLKEGGVIALREAGIKVEVLCDSGAGKLIRPFVKHRLLGRPYITVKISSTLDGKVATLSGKSKWITSEESRMAGHSLRKESDAILVGIETVLHDDPLLTNRLEGEENVHHPRRVILDSHLRIPATAKVLTDRTSPTLIASLRSLEEIPDIFKREGVSFIQCREDSGRISLLNLAEHLADLGILSLLVEGGPSVISSFLRAGLVDRVVQFVSPSYLGEEGRSGIGTLGITDLERRMWLKDISIQNIGPDLRIEGEVCV